MRLPTADRKISAATLLGIAGSLGAGLIGQFLGWYKAGEGARFIASVIVAVILLAVYGRLRGGAKAP